MQAENSFQPVIDRFEDDVLALAYYIKDRDVICGEYNFAKWMVYLYIQSTAYMYVEEITTASFSSTT